MRLIQSIFTIAEIREQVGRKDLIVNESYQRSSNIWPPYAQSYFIDTILEGYPIPKIYVYEVYDDKKQKPRREIVDGQQRVTTITAFANNNFKLTSSSKNFKGLAFDDLEPQDRKKYLMTPLQVDIIVSAERNELLEMFRRINAYTAPLNEAEKRHSEFQGEFKWFINEMSDEYSPLLEQFGVMSPKQIVRMTDAEFLTEFALVLEKGVINKSSASLRSIYKSNDDLFPKKEAYQKKIADFFETLKSDLSELQETYMMKSYALYSLFCSMTHRKYGIPNGDSVTGIPKEGVYYRDRKKTIQNLKSLAYAHETQDLEGKYKKYVEACLSTTHRIAQRQQRARFIARALE